MPHSPGGFCLALSVSVVLVAGAAPAAALPGSQHSSHTSREDSYILAVGTNTTISNASIDEMVRLRGDRASNFLWFRRAGKAYLWTFVTPDLTVYRYATTRSGSVPAEVLGDSKGRLLVDAYTGYNAVTSTGRRTRAGCWAHARRKLFEQQAHPEVAPVLELISALYRVERDAKKACILGTDKHLALRTTRARPIMALIFRWARFHRARHEPRSALGRAIAYLLNNHAALTLCTRHPSLPLDNNIAERSLRRVAMGRANFLFVGHEPSGHRHAVLYTLINSCQQNGKNPVDYLTDVLSRIDGHPARDIIDLLPHRWQPPDASVPTAGT